MPISAGSAMLVLVVITLVATAACLPDARALLVIWLLAVACSWRSVPDGRS